MKTTLLSCLGSIALALSLFGQTPTTPSPSPSTQPTASIAPAAPTPVAPAPAIAGATVSPAVNASPTADEEDDSIDRAVARKLKHHFGVTIGKHHGAAVVDHHNDDRDFPDAGALMAIPIVGIIFTTLFGAPVLIVAAIMFFSYLKSRSLHRTVREMVEKGQEVPAALFVTPPVARTRNDLRRGVILIMVGIGVMIFLGAASDWDGGAWSMGMIPFLIGLGYFLVWKLEDRKDKVPPLP